MTTPVHLLAHEQFSVGRDDARVRVEADFVDVLELLDSAQFLLLGEAGMLKQTHQLRYFIEEQHLYLAHYVIVHEVKDNADCCLKRAGNLASLPPLVVFDTPNDK